MMIKEGGQNPESRIAYGFRLAAGRRIEARELSVLGRALSRLRNQYAVDKDAALKVVSSGESPRDATLDSGELAAYAGVAALISMLRRETSQSINFASV